MSNGWTPERKQRQPEIIRQWKPWEKSTRPRTEADQYAVTKNVLMNQKYSPELHTIRKLLQKQDQFIQSIINDQ